MIMIIDVYIFKIETSIMNKNAEYEQEQYHLEKRYTEFPFKFMNHNTNLWGGKVPNCAFFSPSTFPSYNHLVHCTSKMPQTPPSTVTNFLFLSGLRC